MNLTQEMIDDKNYHPLIVKKYMILLDNVKNFLDSRNVNGPNDWKNEYHKKLAQLVDYKYKSSKERDLEQELSSWQQYASYLKSCVLSGEHNPESFDKFISKNIWR